MKLYKLLILTPEKKIYDGAVISITVTGENGLLTILAGHAPMVALLVKGPIIIKTEQEILEGEAEQGILKVNSNEASVLVRSFKWVDEKASS